MSVPLENLAHLAEARALLIEQFKTRPVLDGFLRAYVNRVQALEVAVFDVIDGRILNTATASQLDSLGSLVGEKRLGRTDEEFRQAIRLRIRVNRSNGKTVDVLSVAMLAAAPERVTYDEHGFLQFTVEIYNRPGERYVAELLGKTRAATSAGILIASDLAVSGLLTFDDAVSPIAGTETFSDEVSGGRVTAAGYALPTDFSGVFLLTTIVPSVLSLSPSSGPAGGGQSVTLTGSGFTSATGGTIGGAPLGSFAVVNDTTITGVTPAGTAGAQTVNVTGPGGTGTLAGGYTYVAAPTVTGATPNTGRSSGGQSTNLAGTGFTGATGVTFNGVAATGVAVNSDTSITCNVPAGTPGNATIAVTGPGGTGSLASGYFYLDATALELWFRGDFGLTQAANRVSAWNNQSGSADANRNLTQGTGANQPRFVASNSAFNNRPTVGTLTTSDEDLSMQSGTFAAAIGTTATVYHVLRIPSGLGNNVALRWGLGTYANAPSFVVDTGMTSYQSNDGTNLLQTAGALAAGTVYVVCSIYSGATNGATYVNRHTTASATGNAGSTSMNTLRIGTIAGFATRYETAEIIAYSGAHAQAKRQEIMAYLGTRYGVTIIP